MKKIILFLFLLFLIDNVYAINAKLSKCVDGDTANFIINEEIVKVRFLAIDTPESTNEKEEWGEEASSYTCSILTNAKVINLELDTNSDDYDKYGRLLAWVFVDNNLLQKDIVKLGYGDVAYLYGDYKYTSILNDALDTAKRNKVGIWSGTKEPNYIYIILLIIVSIYPIYKRINKALKKYKKLL